MGMTIDHLCRDLRIRVVRGFVDLNGVRQEPGVVGTIRELGWDMLKREITIDWDVGGRREQMRFPLRSEDAPGNGTMRQFFESLGDEPPPPGTRPRISRAPLSEKPPGLRSSRKLPKTASDGEILQRAWALAALGRFKEADEQFAEVSQPTDQDPARYLTRAAEIHADDPDPATYEWLKDHALDLWYMWGSTATSGGEGAAMAPHIHEARDRFQEIDRLRARPA